MEPVSIFWISTYEFLVGCLVSDTYYLAYWSCFYVHIPEFKLGRTKDTKILSFYCKQSIYIHTSLLQGGQYVHFVRFVRCTSLQCTFCTFYRLLYRMDFFVYVLYILWIFFVYILCILVIFIYCIYFNNYILYLL